MAAASSVPKTSGPTRSHSEFIPAGRPPFFGELLR